MSKKQLSLNIFKGKRGGRRPGSGRKRIHSKGVAHREREKVTKRTPLHINFKFKTAIKNKDSLRLLKRAILNASTHGLRIIHFSLQWNHIHLIVESDSNEILTRGMRSLAVTFAKGLKRGEFRLKDITCMFLKRSRKLVMQSIMFCLISKNMKRAHIQKLMNIPHYYKWKKL